MSQSSWDTPPDFRDKPKEFADYILELHNIIFGLGGDVKGTVDTENVPNDHASNKDTFLDQGGVNEVTAANAADAVAKRHTQNTDTSLDLGGLNPVTAAAAKIAADTHAIAAHDVLRQAVALTDAVASVVSVTSANADLTYSQNEVDLMNEMKGDINTLVTDLNNLVTKFNTLLTNLETAGLQAL